MKFGLDEDKMDNLGDALMRAGGAMMQGNSPYALQNIGGGVIAGVDEYTDSKAREKLYRLLDEAASSHEPIQITGKRNNVVLISEEDWNSVQETLYLLSIPGMRESIREGMETPLEDTSAEPGW